MTYTELQYAAKTWTASHIAQDMFLMFGDVEASSADVLKVSEAQEAEGGDRIAPELTENDKLVRDLRALASFYETNPSVQRPYIDTVCIFGADKAQMRIGAKAFGKSEKRFDGQYFILEKAFGDIKLQYYSQRDAVCERVVVGKKLLPAVTIPAQEKKVIPAQEVEDVEWVCGSLLGE